MRSALQRLSQTHCRGCHIPAATAAPRQTELRRSVRGVRGDDAQHGHRGHRSGRAPAQLERTAAGRLRIPIGRPQFGAL